MTPRTVLGLFAHPDDETFGPGSTLAMLAAQGHPVHLFCATRGDAGTIGNSAALGRRALAALRETELRQASLALGLLRVEILNLPDGGLSRLQEETLLRPMVRAIRTLRPDILISFHEDGISGHPDHRTVTARAVRAFDLAAERGLWPDLGEPHAAARFWAYCVPASQARRLTARRLFAVEDVDVDADLEVSAFIPAKRAAIEAHASQKPFIDWLEQQLGGLEDYWARDTFVLAASRVPLPEKASRPVASLFAGMD